MDDHTHLTHTHTHTWEVMEEYDVDGSGALDFAEFVAMVTHTITLYLTIISRLFHDDFTII